MGQTRVSVSSESPVVFGKENQTAVTLKFPLLGTFAELSKAAQVALSAHLEEIISLEV